MFVPTLQIGAWGAESNDLFKFTELVCGRAETGIQVTGDNPVFSEHHRASQSYVHVLYSCVWVNHCLFAIYLQTTFS